MRTRSRTRVNGAAHICCNRASGLSESVDNNRTSNPPELLCTHFQPLTTINCSSIISAVGAITLSPHSLPQSARQAVCAAVTKSRPHIGGLEVRHRPADRVGRRTGPAPRPAAAHASSAPGMDGWAARTHERVVPVPTTAVVGAGSEDGLSAGQTGYPPPSVSRIVSRAVADIPLSNSYPVDG